MRNFPTSWAKLKTLVHLPLPQRGRRSTYSAFHMLSLGIKFGPSVHLKPHVPLMNLKYETFEPLKRWRRPQFSLFFFFFHSAAGFCLPSSGDLRRVCHVFCFFLPCFEESPFFPPLGEFKCDADFLSS